VGDDDFIDVRTNAQRRQVQWSDLGGIGGRESPINKMEPAIHPRNDITSRAYPCKTFPCIYIPHKFVQENFDKRDKKKHR
jgi:hypothetical protein